MKEKMEKSRQEAATETEQIVLELKRRHDREKQILLEDNNKLSSNVEFVSFSLLFII